MLRTKMNMFILPILASMIIVSSVEACVGGFFARARERRQSRIQARQEARVGYAGCANNAVYYSK